MVYSQVNITIQMSILTEWEAVAVIAKIVWVTKIQNK